MLRIPGEHAPNIKNRSSKHLMLLVGQKSSYRCMNNAKLHELANAGNPMANREISRRAKKNRK